MHYCPGMCYKILSHILPPNVWS